MVMWTQSDFKMRAEFQCPLNEAIDCMSRLTLECVTPLEKLLCLKQCHDEINRAVERNLTRWVVLVVLSPRFFCFFYYFISLSDQQQQQQQK